MYKKGLISIIILIIAVLVLGVGAYYVTTRLADDLYVSVNDDSSFGNTESKILDVGTTTGTTSPGMVAGVSTGPEDFNSNSSFATNSGSLNNTSNSSNRTTSNITTNNSRIEQQPVSVGGVGLNSNQTASVPTSVAATQLNKGAIDVILHSDGASWRAGGTYAIEWKLNQNISSRKYHDFKVELIEVGRIDVGPVLIASYSNRSIRNIPRSISFTLPASMDANTWYAIKVTYKTSNENYFGDQGFEGRTYVGTSPAFMIENRVQSSVRTQAINGESDTLELDSLSFALPSNVEAQTRNVPFVRMRATAENTSVTLTHLALGSPEGNEIFNYVENVKAEIDGRMMNMTFSNEYLQGTTLWRFDSPVVIPRNSSETITIMADIKPGIHDMTIQGAVKGGRANVAVLGNIIGPRISVE